MQVVEIRYNRKKLILLLTVFAVSLLIGSWYIQFGGMFKANNAVRILNVLIIGMSIYMMYYPTRRLINNEPFLVLSKEAIEVAQRSKLVPYFWDQINDCRFEKDDKNNYLIIETATGEKKIALPSLEKTPFEIEMLLEDYKKLIRKRS